MKNYLITLLALLLIPLGLSGQSLTGRVVDARTREALPFATVILLPNRASGYTNERGEFALAGGWAAERDSLLITYVGYGGLRLRALSYLNGDFTEIGLVASVELPTVEVTVPIDYVGNSSSVLSPRISELESVPALLGENDPLKALAFLPGVSTGLEGTAGVQLRGGNANQTDLLIDGVRVYNVNHVGGFLSAVPAYGVRDITVYKGGTPARFGGRLSGVLDISLREGRKDQHTQEFTLGTALIRGGAEGPIGKRSSYIVHGRLGYPTQLYSLFSRGSYKKAVRGNHQTFNLADFYGKYTYRHRGWEVSLSTFQSGDWGFDQTNVNQLLLLDDFNWTNATYALNLRRRLNPKTTLYSTLSYLDYSYNYTNLSVIQDEDGNDSAEAGSIFATDNYSANVRVVHETSKLLQLSAGGEWLQQSFDASFEAINSRAEEPRLSQNFLQQSSTFSGFGQADFSLADRLELMAGLRYGYFNGRIQAGYWQPRLRVSLKLKPNLFFNAGYDGNVQFDHQLRTDLSIFPNEFWVQANDLLPPSLSRQVYAGLGGSLPAIQNIQWSVEIFYKRMENLARIIPGQEVAVRFETELSEAEIATRGDGRAKGLEVFLRKTTGDFQFWLAYTLSSSERRYAVINEGEWFPFTFDRRHDLSSRVSQKLARGWALNASFVFQTGISFTAPIATTALYDIYGSYNNARYPPFHVLNLGADRSWMGKKHPQRQHQISFSIYNAYNRANPYSVNVSLKQEQQTNPTTGATETVVSRGIVTRSLLPIVPGISYRIRLGSPQKKVEN
jgi:outer membrane cobalamin receptor